MAGNGRRSAKGKGKDLPAVGGGFDEVKPLDGLKPDWEFEELEPIGLICLMLPS